MPETGRDEDAFARLIADTRSSDVYERLRAAEQLGATGDARAVEPLIALLHDPAYRVVEAALTSLGNQGNPSAVESIAAVFEDRDLMATMGRADAISTAAAEALRKLGESGFQALIRLLREHAASEFEGLALVQALKQVADPRSLDALAVALHSPVYEVGDAAAGALVQFGESAVPLLVTSLTATGRYTAYHARQALIGYRPALSHLLELLRTSETGYVRARTVLAIASIDDPRVPDILRSALEDADEKVRHAAVEALGEHGDLSVIEQLLDLPVSTEGENSAVSILTEYGPEIAVLLLDVLQDRERSPEARARAAKVLGRLEDKDAVEPLISALQDDDDGVRCAAAGALGDLKDTRAVEPLTAALRDDDEHVRRAAATSLGQLGDARAFEPLLELFAKDTPGVRASVIGALLHFDDPRAFDTVVAFARNPEEDRKLRIHVIVNPRFNHKSGALPVLRQLALAAHGDPRENLEAYYLALAAMGPLSRLGHPGIHAVIEAAQSSHISLCLHALPQLQRSDAELDNDTIEQVAALLSDPRAPVRHQAAIDLGEHGDSRAIEPLIEALRHPSWLVQQKAARALGKVGDERAIPALEQALAETSNADMSQPQQRSAEFELHDTIERAILSIRGRQHDEVKRAESES